METVFNDVDGTIAQAMQLMNSDGECLPALWCFLHSLRSLATMPGVQQARWVPACATLTQWCRSPSFCGGGALQVLFALPFTPCCLPSPRPPSSLASAERAERMEVEKEAVKIQTNVRAWLLQRNYKSVRQSVTRLQAGRLAPTSRWAFFSCTWPWALQARPLLPVGQPLSACSIRRQAHAAGTAT